MLAVGMTFASLLAGQYASPFRRRAVSSTCAALLGVWSILSFRQAGFWRDDVALWERAIAVNPRSFLAHSNYGVVLFRQGDLARAEALFRKAIELKPDYATGHDNLALVLIQTGRENEAIERIERVLEISGQMPPALRPRLDKAHNLFGQVLMQRNRPREAAEHFRAALRLNPGFEEARQNLARAEQLLRGLGTSPSN
jgi:tetratricopeptide (TPR) repeat protein